MGTNSHFLVPQRQTDKSGFGPERYGAFSGRPGKPNPEHKRLREEYFRCVNDALADAGVRGVYYDPHKQEKAPGVHKGKARAAIERKEVERVKRERWAAMEEFLRPALRSLLETGETYQTGIGDTWWERAEAAGAPEEPSAPAPPVSYSWRAFAARPSSAGRSR